MSAVKCPFFRYEKSLKLVCDAGKIQFPDMQTRCEYLSRYCASSKDYDKCSLADALLRYYERIG